MTTDNPLDAICRRGNQGWLSHDYNFTIRECRRCGAKLVIDYALDTSDPDWEEKKEHRDKRRERSEP